MAKYLLLKHYHRGPDAPAGLHTPMNEWTQPEREAHFAFQRDTCQMLIDSGEFVGAEGVAPTGSFVRYAGPAAAPVVEPFASDKELIAGWFLIDVASEERAYEIAAHVSSAPGAGGEPIHEWLEVRAIMEAPPDPSEW